VVDLRLLSAKRFVMEVVCEVVPANGSTILAVIVMILISIGLGIVPLLALVPLVNGLFVGSLVL